MDGEDVPDEERERMEEAADVARVRVTDGDGEGDEDGIEDRDGDGE